MKLFEPVILFYIHYQHHVQQLVILMKLQIMEERKKMEFCNYFEPGAVFLTVSP